LLATDLLPFIRRAIQGRLTEEDAVVEVDKND